MTRSLWATPIFVVILVIAALVRLLFLNVYPPSLNWDEVSLAYNAYSLLQTGHDEWGRFLPLSFEAFGEYKLPAYIYAAIPSVALFGLSEYGARIPSAMAGIVTVIFAYLIVWRVTQNRLMSLSAMGLLAIEPWHIFVSRSALEANLALCLVTVAVYFFIKGVEQGKYFIWSSVFFVLSLYTYNSTRVFVPLLVLVLVLWFRKAFFQNKKIAFITITIFATLFAIGLPLAAREAAARYNSVLILDQGAINRINEMRGLFNGPEIVAKFLYNKPNYFIVAAANNYLSYFSPIYLFVTGGSQYQFSLPNFGLLYWLDLPFWVAGLWYLMRAKNRYLFVLLAWLLLAPIPAAITRETPHVLRSLNMFVPITLLSGIGMGYVFTALKRKATIFSVVYSIGLIGVVGYQLLLFGLQYTKTYPAQFSCTWQYGSKEMVSYITNYQKEYDKVLITKLYGEPHIFLLFFAPITPKDYYTDPNLIRYNQTNHAWVDQFDKYIFVNDWELQGKLKQLIDQDAGKILVVTGPNNYPRNLRPTESISFLNGQKAFDILSIDTATTTVASGDLWPPKPIRGCNYPI